MLRVPAPPAGSEISLREQGDETIIEIPYPASTAIRWFVGMALTIWLGVWSISGGTLIVFGLKSPPPAPSVPFSIVALAAWVFGCLVGGTALYRTIRPSRPETLQLTPTEILFDFGSAPVRLGLGLSFGRGNPFRIDFPKRHRYAIEPSALASMRLRTTQENDTELTVDLGTVRIAIAREATNTDREWLYQVLTSKYGVPAQISDNRAFA